MTTQTLRVLVAFVSGAVFSFGLCLSRMLDPVVVRGFLDIFGAWNPSLAFVLGGAVVAAFGGVAIMRRIPHPALDTQFHVPTNRGIDARLILGSGIFGIGWGMAGLCPGPALTALTLGLPTVALFVIAMLTGIVMHDRLRMGRRR